MALDLKDPKNQKVILAVLIGILIVYFWYARFYSANAEKLNTKQIEYERMLTNLRNVELKAKSFTALKAEYEELLARYKNVELLLPEEKQIPLFLTQMHRAAQKSGCRITQIIPKGTTPMSFYYANDFDITLVGGYHDIGSFFSSIANFPFIANISVVGFTGLTSQQASVAVAGKKSTVSVTFKLTTYFIKESERLKRIEL